MDLQRQADLLNRVPMFHKLEPAKLKLLAFTSEYLRFEDEEIVFRAGKPADCAYVIMDGAVDLLNETDEGVLVAGTLGKNQLFGEMGVLMNAPRLTTLRARGHLEVLRIDGEAFVRLLTENPDVSLSVMRQLAEKIASTHSRFEELQKRMQRAERGGSDPA